MARNGTWNGMAPGTEWHLDGTWMAPGWHLDGTWMAPGWHLDGTWMDSFLFYLDLI
jgi:hypothetical protein